MESRNNDDINKGALIEKVPTLEDLLRDAELEKRMFSYIEKDKCTENVNPNDMVSKNMGTNDTMGYSNHQESKREILSELANNNAAELIPSQGDSFNKVNCGFNPSKEFTYEDVVNHIAESGLSKFCDILALRKFFATNVEEKREKSPKQTDSFCSRKREKYECILCGKRMYIRSLEGHFYYHRYGPDDLKRFVCLFQDCDKSYNHYLSFCRHFSKRHNTAENDDIYVEDSRPQLNPFDMQEITDIFTPVLD